MAWFIPVPALPGPSTSEIAWPLSAPSRPLRNARVRLASRAVGLTAGLPFFEASASFWVASVFPTFPGSSGAALPSSAPASSFFSPTLGFGGGGGGRRTSEIQCWFSARESHEPGLTGGALWIAVMRTPRSAALPRSMVVKRSVSHPPGRRPARRAGRTQRRSRERRPNRTRTDSRSRGSSTSEPAAPSLRRPSSRISAMATGCAPSKMVHSAPSGTVTRRWRSSTRASSKAFPSP